jgi:hypothetical protein
LRRHFKQTVLSDIRNAEIVPNRRGLFFNAGFVAPAGVLPKLKATAL